MTHPPTPMVDPTDPTKLLTPSGTVLANIHSARLCEGHGCSVHHPSNHHMTGWRMAWRRDLHCFERICPTHGIGHPDPDDVAAALARGPARQPIGVHGCCGCCRRPR